MYLLIATDNALAFARAGFCKDKNLLYSFS